MTLLAIADFIGSIASLEGFLYRFIDIFFSGTLTNQVRLVCIPIASGMPAGKKRDFFYKVPPNTAIMCSQYANVLLTLDRYLALAQPTKYRIWNHGKHVKWGACVVACGGLITAISVYVGVDVYERTATCQATHVGALLFKGLWLIQSTNASAYAGAH